MDLGSMWLNLAGWDWALIGKTAAGAGLGTAVTQSGISWIKYRYRRRSMAADLAIRLAITFEEYAAACADLNGSNSNAPEEPNEQWPRYNAVLPVLREDPDDSEGWRSLGLEIASRCRGLRGHIRDSQGLIYAVFELDDYPDRALYQHVAERGMEAWRLAAELRAKYGIPVASPLWDYPGALEQTLSEGEEWKARAAAEHAKMMLEYPFASTADQTNS